MQSLFNIFIFALRLKLNIIRKFFSYVPTLLSIYVSNQTKLPMNSEKELINSCIDGDIRAQRELYEHFGGKLKAIALRYSKSHEEAEDILQDAFLKIFDNLPRFEYKSKLETWMIRIVINVALNSIRNRVYMFPLSEVDENVQEEAQEVDLGGFDFKELIQMVQSLPAGCQVIFNLYAVEGYNHREIAKMMSISEGTSKSQYARAKSLLKDMIKQARNLNYGNI